MSKTSLTIATALLLGLVSIGLILGRWYVLGSEIDGTPGDAVWKVSLVVKGELTAPDASVTIRLPPDFRRQHVLDEQFDSKELSHTVRTSKEGGQRRAVWRPRSRADVPQKFQLTYSFRTILGMRRPTPIMIHRGHTRDAAPAPEGAEVKRAPLIESDHSEMATLADRLDPENRDDEERVRAFFTYAGDLPAGEANGALAALREEAASTAGRSRLLIALCRNRKIPARLVSGLVLDEEGERGLHYWVEAWVANHWLPMDPARRLFDAARLPSNYFVLHLGDEPVRGERARLRVAFIATDLHNSSGPEGGQPPSTAKRIWRKMSLSRLQPEDQAWVKFLLLLPVGALVVCVFRTVIGITTFGTFAPALLGLVCQDLHDFPWALSVFLAIMIIGWGVRLLLDRYHLLLAPRISVVLTVIVILLLAGVMLLGPSLGPKHGYIGLLPLIILTHMIERFWTVETEDGTAASLRTLLNTVVVAIVITMLVHVDVLVNGVLRWMKYGPALPPDLVRTTLFRYPEALGLVLAGQLLLGRYTGYRLTELFRFRDLLLEESPSEGSHEPAGPRATAPRDGRSGDEST
jgi:hypothetical protein